MKRLFPVVLFVVWAMFIVSSVRAEEAWDPHLRGVDDGLAAGALPPAGVYFINDSYFADFKSYNNSGNAVPGISLNVYVDVPIILWSTGLKVFGASYAVAIAQPFDYTNLTIGSSGSGTQLGNSQLGFYNTVLVPGILSWDLPHNLHLATSLSVLVGDATSAKPVNIPLAPSGSGFWTFEPGVGISWLYDGWNLSAKVGLDLNLTNPNDDYWSAPDLWIDYTITKTVGKWIVGLGAYQQNQLSSDTQHGQKVANSEASNLGLGPIIGYNFGPVDIEATYQQAIVNRNDVGGSFCNVRLVIPF